MEEEKEKEKGGEREYFGRDRQISIGYAKWAGERLFTVMAGGRWLVVPNKAWAPILFRLPRAFS